MFSNKTSRDVGMVPPVEKPKGIYRNKEGYAMIF